MGSIPRRGGEGVRCNHRIIQNTHDKTLWSTQNRCANILKNFFGRGQMSLFSSALKKERWDLAAHIIVLAAVRALGRGEQTNGKDRKTKKRCAVRE
jgi:hypothetical protein